MEWLGIGDRGPTRAVVGASFSGRASQNARPELGGLGLNMASDRQLALFTLRRELANCLVRLEHVLYADRLHVNQPCVRE